MDGNQIETDSSAQACHEEEELKQPEEKRLSLKPLFSNESLIPNFFMKNNKIGTSNRF